MFLQQFAFIIHNLKTNLKKIEIVSLSQNQHDRMIHQG